MVAHVGALARQPSRLLLVRADDHAHLRYAPPHRSAGADMYVRVWIPSAVTSVLDTADVCLQVARQAAPDVGFFKLPSEGDQFIEGSMFAGSAYGLLAGLCCLLTNVAATSLIAYRAWCVPCAPVDHTVANHSIRTSL